MGCFHLVYNLIPRFLRLTSFGTSSQRSRNEVRWVGIGRNRIVGIRESNSTQGAADRATTKGVSSNRRSAADGCTPGVRQSWAIAPSDRAGLADTGEMHLRNRGHLLFPSQFAWQRKTECLQPLILRAPTAPALTRLYVFFVDFLGFLRPEKATLSHRSHAKHQ